VAILLLLGSLFFFANFLFEKSFLIPAHFGALEGFRGSPEILTWWDLRACFFSCPFSVCGMDGL
jgi:hypothetical protein